MLLLLALLTSVAAADECLVLVNADYRTVTQAPWLQGADIARIGEDYLILVCDAGAPETLPPGQVIDCVERADLAYVQVWPTSPAGRERAQQLGRIVFARDDYLLIRREGDPPADFTLEGIRAVTPLRTHRLGATARSVPVRTDRDPLVEQIVDAVSETEFRGDIQRLENLQSRNARGPGYVQACSNVRAAFEAYGYDTELQEYTALPWYGPQFTCWNVIGEAVGTEYPDQIYIVCGHLDSTAGAPWQHELIAPGADDNASGSATVLEAARVMAGLDFRYTVRFICFGAEEQGLCGSTYYAQQAAAAGEDIRGVVNADMILYGPPGMDTFLISYDAQSQTLAQAYQAAAAAYVPELDLEILYDPGAVYSDHAPFWENGFAAVESIERYYGSNPYYHSVDDRLVQYTGYFPFGTRCAKAAIATVAELAEPVPTSAVEADFAAAAGDPWRVSAWPNPAGHATEVVFRAPGDGDYELSLHDVLGRTLLAHRGRAGSSGEVSVDLALEDLTPGVYFIRAGQGRQEGRLRLVVTR
jgi:hypothetical protein